MDGFLLGNPVLRTGDNHRQANMEWRQLIDTSDIWKTMALKKEIQDPDRNVHRALGGNVRPSGYVSRGEELWYGMSGPFYDVLTWWCFLPLGGERACRKTFVSWFAVKPGHEVLSLCCGTGTTERILVEAIPSAHVTAIDLGAGQIATARKKDRSGLIDYRVGDASDTGLHAATFDRVLITLALHEMPRVLRHSVLREAARVCRPDGRVIAIEHATPTGRLSRILRGVWWFYWVPGNPEVATTFDLQRNGLANEMEQAGLRVVERRVTRPEWIEGVIAESVGTSGKPE